MGETDCSTHHERRAQRCGECHAAAAPTPAPRPSDIRDLGKLAQEGYVADCSAERSPLVDARRGRRLPDVAEGMALVPEQNIRDQLGPDEPSEVR